MKIFGIGLSKTGTKSLTKALNILGYNIYHYPIDEVTYKELISGNCNLSILNHCDGITDITVVPYYAQLHRLFPSSKFILTIRDKQSWLKSMQNEWNKKVDNLNNSKYELQMRLRYFLRAAVYGCVNYNLDRLSYVYELHQKNVTDYFKDFKDTLLVLDILNGDGWDTLCPFLDRKIPDTNFSLINNWKEL